MKKEGYSSSFSLKLYVLAQRFPLLRYFKVILYFFDGILLLFIKKPKKDKDGKKKVLIIYNYAFGDGIIFLNAFDSIRKIYPKSKFEVSLICQKGLNSIYENSNMFDEVISYDLTRSTFHLGIRFSLYKLLRRKYYDIVLDPIGVAECTMNVFMSRVLCANQKITILDTTLDSKRCPKFIYNSIYTEIVKVRISNLSLLEYYGELICKLMNTEYKVGFHKMDVPQVELPTKYFIAFPSASTQLKRWPSERYAILVKKIYEYTKIPLLFCGTNSDTDSINELKSLIEGIPYYDYVNQTSLLEFINVVQKASFVITNDTSTYHIAVTQQVPVTIITGGYTYSRYVEYKFKDMEKYKKPYIAAKCMDCFNCDNDCKKLKKTDTIWPCLNDVTVDLAWSKVKEMIDNLTLEV